MTTTAIRVVRVLIGLPAAVVGFGCAVLGGFAMTGTNDVAIGAGVLAVGGALGFGGLALLRDQFGGFFAVPEGADDEIPEYMLPNGPMVNPTTGSMMLNGTGGLDATGHFYGQIISHEPPPRA